MKVKYVRMIKLGEFGPDLFVTLDGELPFTPFLGLQIELPDTDDEFFVCEVAWVVKEGVMHLYTETDTESYRTDDFYQWLGELRAQGWEPEFRDWPDRTGEPWGDDLDADDLARSREDA